MNLINWAGYVEKDWVTPFETETGCKVNSKVGATSDEMVTLMKTALRRRLGVRRRNTAPDRRRRRGRSRPGHDRELRHRLRGPQGPAAEHRGRRAVRRAARARANLMFRTDVVKPAPTSWSVVWEATSPYKGKITAYDSPIYIADAAVYLKATQPDPQHHRSLRAGRQAVPGGRRPAQAAEREHR